MVERERSRAALAAAMLRAASRPGVSRLPGCHCGERGRWRIGICCGAAGGSWRGWRGSWRR
eukprot:3109719-Pleurochrysis_carterae.AAC.1